MSAAACVPRVGAEQRLEDRGLPGSTRCTSSPYGCIPSATVAVVAPGTRVPAWREPTGLDPSRRCLTDDRAGFVDVDRGRDGFDVLVGGARDVTSTCPDPTSTFTEPPAHPPPTGRGRRPSGRPNAQRSQVLAVQVIDIETWRPHHRRDHPPVGVA